MLKNTELIIKNHLRYMKSILVVLLFFSLNILYAQNGDNVIVDTDGKIYKTVKIGSQSWMAENLNFATYSGSCCFDNDLTNCNKYGRLYTWEMAQLSCPLGWKIPSVDEWRTLFSNILDSFAGNVSKMKWNNNVNSGFKDSLKYSGAWIVSEKNSGPLFYGIDEFAGFWSSDQHHDDGVLCASFSLKDSIVSYKNTIYRSSMLSVRCIKKTIDLIDIPPPAVLKEKNVTSNVLISEDTTVYTVAEEMPYYTGGNDARIKFLIGNLKYPQIAKEKNIQGTVYISFVVEGNGSLSNINIARSLGNGFDEEAIKVVKLMPKWNPGIQNGKAVRVRVNMPVKFSM